MRRKFVVGCVLLLALNLGSSSSANGIDPALNPSEVELQHMMEHMTSQGTFVATTGTGTEGKTVKIGSRDIKLPKGYFIKHYLMGVDCAPTEPCPNGPVIVIGRGNSEKWYEQRTGKDLLTRIAPGEGEFYDLVTRGSYDNNPTVTINDYLGETWDDQTSNAGVENWINWDLVQDQSIKYYVNSSQLVADANTAASRWNTALGKTVFEAVSTPSQANLTVEEIGAVLGYGATEFTYLWNDSTRNANYAAKATVKITVTYPSSGWARTMTHEFGHVLGLGEQYVLTTPVTCNTSKPSVMWSSDCSGAPSSPTTYDTGRFNTAYKNGSLGSPTGSASGSNYTFTWTDLSWGENYFDLTFEREFSPGSWSVVGRVAHTTNSGLRSTATWNTLSLTRTFSRTTYGQAAGNYRVCARTQHNLIGIWYQGTTQCGPSLNLS